MNTTTMEQFNVLNADALATVEGGSKGDCKFVMAGANGYSCRYPDGKWAYIVTKSPFEATVDVMVNGWVSSLAGGYFHPGYRG
ncbi:garvicin Q family class II bacteriocin [Streptococcus ovuberis]|uniref:Garvicin Q family class II bacteriocin n=1 Tax=Streptococcus ovuberis TaxID=1936207 RepID=A0A7X6MZB6_9STRE|nr:garvicin Q family class II bacteriocin [Streptococcus ovuberis]NKZ20141.1 garvicin Q family class II bacteriocin [Streptococcus ovuberis]